jgi:hypothetical protein
MISVEMYCEICDTTYPTWQIKGVPSADQWLRTHLAVRCPANAGSLEWIADNRGFDAALKVLPRVVMALERESSLAKRTKRLGLEGIGKSSA